MTGTDDIEVFYYDRAYFLHRNQYIDHWGNKVKIDNDKKIVYLEGQWPDFWREFGHNLEVSIDLDHQLIVTSNWFKGEVGVIKLLNQNSYE